MTKLKPGLYHIRFVPIGLQPPFMGGLYATPTEINQPILAEAEGPKDFPTWEVRLNDNNNYIITQPGFQSKHAGFGPGPVLAGWGLAYPPEARPTGNILFTVDYVELDIEPTGAGEHLMYSVSIPPPKGLVGVQFIVTEREQVLISAPFMAGVAHPPPHPHWQFIPAKC